MASGRNYYDSKQIGNVEVPQKAFLSVLKLDED